MLGNCENISDVSILRNVERINFSYTKISYFFNVRKC